MPATPAAAPDQAALPRPRLGDPLLILNDRLAARDDLRVALPVRASAGIRHVSAPLAGPPTLNRVRGYVVWEGAVRPAASLSATGLTSPGADAYEVLLRTPGHPGGVVLAIEGVTAVAWLDHLDRPLDLADLDGVAHLANARGHDLALLDPEAVLGRVLG